MFLLALLGIALTLNGMPCEAAPPPTSSSIGSDLHFLFQNDLNWPNAQDHNGTIYLNTPLTYGKALEACQHLNEGLLSTSGKYFETDAANLVKYLRYDSQTPLWQRFWVAGQTVAGCRTYSLVGGLGVAPCGQTLPVFCSQSAPYRPNTDVDKNSAYEVQVQSSNITFVGNRDHLSFRFLGIPFANPVERFAYSTPYTTSSPVTLSATSYGPACVQPGTGQEDCLSMNIYAPYIPLNPVDARRKKKLKPVLVWIFGGAFLLGDASTPTYDGGNMASRNDIVYVSFNYRLGALGFLTLDDGVVNGNFGLSDQVTALQWVQTHIAAFGGDPDRVTIYGESAGAVSVRALLSSPPVFGLFGGAIAQSNAGGLFLSSYSGFVTPADQYNALDKPFVESIGCGKNATSDTLGCLRALPASLISAIPALRAPVVDGHYITGPRLGVAHNAPVAPARIIFGWLRDDAAPIAQLLPAESVTQAQSLIASGIAPDLAAKIVAAPDVFPPPNGPNATINMFNLTSQVLTAAAFSCADQAIVKSAGKHNAFPAVYAYSFDRSYTNDPVTTPVSVLCSPPKTAEHPGGDMKQPYFRCHGGELYYTAGTLGQTSVPFRDADDLLMSQITVDAWGSFARTYDPNPSTDYLNARGYTSSLEVFRKVGPWRPVKPTEKTPLRILDVPLKNAAWSDTARCELLGLPETMFDAP